MIAGKIDPEGLSAAAWALLSRPIPEWRDVHSLAFSPDGRGLLVGTSSDAAMIWDAEAGRLTRKMATSGEVKAVAYFADGARAVTAGGRLNTPAEANVWDAKSGALIHALNRGERSAEAVAVSPDGRIILTGYSAHGASIVAWDAATGAELFRFDPGHFTGTGSIAFFPDSRRFLTGGNDKEAKVWDLDDEWVKELTRTSRPEVEARAKEYRQKSWDRAVERISRLEQEEERRRQQEKVRQEQEEARARAEAEARARARAEEQRQQVQAHRRTEGKCVLCGGPLNFFDRLRKRSQHRTCERYVEK